MNRKTKPFSPSASYHPAVKRLCSICLQPVYAVGGPKMDLCEPCLWTLAQDQDQLSKDVEDMERNPSQSRYWGSPDPNPTPDEILYDP